MRTQPPGRSLKAGAISLVPLAFIYLATVLPTLRQGLMTVSLTGPQWLAAIGLALLLPLVIEGSKWVRRRRLPAAAAIDAEHAVAPSRAVAAEVH